jgi:hypothetical protein
MYLSLSFMHVHDTERAPAHTDLISKFSETKLLSDMYVIAQSV